MSVQPVLTIYKTFHLDIAHALTRVPADHPCARMHGHRLAVTLYLKGSLDLEKGWVQDTNEIQHSFQPLFDQLDHHCLNEIAGLENPTSENLALWIWARMKPILPKLFKIHIAETPNTGVSYEPSA